MLWSLPFVNVQRSMMSFNVDHAYAFPKEEIRGNKRDLCTKSNLNSLDEPGPSDSIQ